MARGRPSAVSQLDVSLQEEVNKLIRQGWIIDDIVARLKEMGAEISRSSMGRHVQKVHEAMTTYREAQEIAKGWVEQLHDTPDGDVARLLPDMLRAIAFSTMRDMGKADQAKPVKPMDVMLLAKAIKDLSGTTKDAFAIDKARREARDQARAELLAEQAKKLDQAAKAKGVTETTRESIREVLGI